jgi:hypothetical protein
VDGVLEDGLPGFEGSEEMEVEVAAAAAGLVRV